MTDQQDLFVEDEFVESIEPAENLSDVEEIDLSAIAQAVVSGNDWTAETIISQINKGNILLNPRFQRRDAWERNRKSSFIESLILGLPIPQLVLAESKTQRGSYIVIDGKQRLLSIRQFAAEPEDDVFQPLKLSGLSIRNDLRGLSLSDLRGDPQRAGDLAAFENQPIRTVVIKNWGSEDFLYQVFLRLNTGSVPLSPQELRQALLPGPFVEFADIASGDSPALRELLKIKKPDFRMRDAELLIRWYAFQCFGSLYRGDLRHFLNHTCDSLNRSWPERQGPIEAMLSDFEAAYEFAQAVFGVNVCRKWTPGGYERPFNRAIFDVLMYFFASPDVRAAADSKRDEVEGAFKDLCENNAEFLSSIERTTKSVGATTARFSIWADKLNELLGLGLVSPVRDAG